MKRLIRWCALLCCAAMLITSVGCSLLESFMGVNPAPTQPSEPNTPVQMVWEVPEKIVLVADHATYGTVSCDWKVYADKADVSEQVTCAVEDTAIAVFENGTATAVAGGKTFLNIRYQNETKKIPVYVLEAQEK